VNAVERWPGRFRRRAGPLFAVSLKQVTVIATSTPATDIRPGVGTGLTEAKLRHHSLLKDYTELFKVRVSALVIITAGAGIYLGCLRSGISPLNFGAIKALLGITAVTCGSSALNQALERKTDRLMHRTQDRPMAAGRIGLVHGLIVGFLLTFVGSLYLALAVNPLTGTLTLLTAVGYVAIYTPLKRVTTLATFVGSFPGAMGPLLGWTAARGRIEWPAIALFAILFVWQFPHFMAIAWLCREDYGKAGFPMLPVIEPDGRRTGQQALLYAAALVPVSIGPSIVGLAGWVYFWLALALGLGRAQERRAAGRL